MEFNRLATQLIPRESIVNRPSIEAHKSLVYGQACMNDIVRHVDVNSRSYCDIHTNLYFDHFVYKRPDDRPRFTPSV